jgi:hypothetical protein
LADFSEGSAERIADRGVLDEFLATWRYHHKLEPGQLAYAGKVTKIAGIFMYHGGDIF